jgi:hypothetical protein
MTANLTTVQGGVKRIPHLEKVTDAGFRIDLDALVTAAPYGYDVHAAADLVIEQLGSLLDNAPPLDEIRAGRWRRQL